MRIYPCGLRLTGPSREYTRASCVRLVRRENITVNTRADLLSLVNKNDLLSRARIEARSQTPNKFGQAGAQCQGVRISVAAVAAAEAATVAQEILRDHLRSSGPLPAVPARPPSRVAWPPVARTVPLPAFLPVPLLPFRPPLGVAPAHPR
eukprot:1175456-Prorocentrum_minimum.AAC.8